MLQRLNLLVTVALLAAPLHAQVEPEKALSRLNAVEGLELTLWAAEPLFVNPTCMDIDERGRVWTCESVNYRDTLRNKPLRRPEGDRILILEDTKGSGKADKVTVFYQDKAILAPLGIAVARDPVGPGYKVYVCQSPDILLFVDKDGDGKADGPPTKLLSGFRGVDHDHGVHGILIGPDNRLYFSVGDQGVSGLVDKNGKKWTSNDTDCRAGTIWRCDLDGKNLELLAHNFRNEYEPCVDSFGTIFVSDNDDDGNQQTRICFVMPGGNYGYHPRGPGQTHWHEEQPGVVPKVLRTYFGSPTGMCFYEGKLLPEKYRGQALHTDAGPRHLRCYQAAPQGAGYQLEREDLVTSTDNWFRPADVCVAPDGSVFIADWYDPGVGGHGMGDTTRGRIFRLAPKGNKPATPKVNLESNEGILAALASPNLAVRAVAMAKLRTLPVDQANKLLRPMTAQKDDPVLRARSLWQLQALNPGQVQPEINQLLQDPDPRFRILGVRILHDFFGHVASSLQSDPSPAVRREVLLSLRDANPAVAAPIWTALAKQYDGRDRFYLCALGIAAGGDAKRRASILERFAQDFPTLDEKTLSLIWELRPPQVLSSLVDKLGDTKLTATKRSQIVDILASADDASGATTLLQILRTTKDTEIRDRVLENLKLFLPGKWRSARQSKELRAAIDDLLGRSETKVAALVLIGAADRQDKIADVLALAKDTKEPLTVRQAALTALGEVPSEKAVEALGQLADTADQPALRTAVVQALGQHAQQRPRKGGADLAPAVQALQKLILDKQRDLAYRQEAALVLANTRIGNEWFLWLNEQKQLPTEFAADIIRILRNSPYQDLRNRALVAFPPPRKLDPTKLPSITGLATRRGDLARGKQLLNASLKSDLQCLRCHKSQGVGGQIGPDLSEIGKKASRENLIESILQPSKAIADQYVTWAVETKNGQLVTGLLIEETKDHILLRDANGKDLKFTPKEIESRAKSPVSLMPNDLLAYMTEDDVVDLVEYLLTLKTP